MLSHLSCGYFYTQKAGDKSKKGQSKIKSKSERNEKMSTEQAQTEVALSIIRASEIEPKWL